jgi:subtilisin family serine protease
VAIIDTGADLTHEALRDRFAPALWDVVADDPTPQDEGPGFAQGHGTHVAGIIARIAPASKLLIVRALDTNGRGSTAKIAYAIDWAVDHGADVINLSLGADFDARILKLAITSAVEQGVVIVAAAGNDNTSTRQYPAAYAQVLSVTAVDAANLKADFANYGSSWVRIAAPGVGITSSIIGPHGSGYASWSGTSMATAFVSGAAALLHQQDPAADVQARNTRLRTHTRDLDGTNPTYVGQLGGLLDVSAALEIESVATATPVTLPTITPTTEATTPPAPTSSAAATPPVLATPDPGTPQPTPTPTATPSPQPTVTGNQDQHYIYLSVVKAGK